MTYLSIAMEWVSFKTIVVLWLQHVDKLDKIDDMDRITIDQKHLPSIAELMYLPKLGFYDFSIVDLMANIAPCACSHKWWERFLDQGTLDTNASPTMAHVRTANMEGVQNRELRAIMTCGLNHIPLRQTTILEIMDEVIHAWSHISSLLKLSNMDTLNGSSWLSTYLWHKLTLAAWKNSGGFKLSYSDELSSCALMEP